MKTPHVVASILLICLLTHTSIAATDNSSHKIEQTDPNQTPLISIDGSPLTESSIDPNSLISSVHIVSQNNENTKYTAIIKSNTPHPGKLPHITFSRRGPLVPPDTYLTSDSKGYSNCSSQSTLHRPTAQALSADLNIPLADNIHPGHKLLTRFIQDEDDINLLTLEITNVGEIPIVFYNGGMNRGPRNNQFQFIAFRNGKPLPDSGNPNHLGGMFVPVTLKPGEKFKKDVDLRKWFDLSQPARYSITGMFIMSIYPADPNRGGFIPSPHEPVWTDYAVAALHFNTRPSPSAPH